MTEAEAPTLAGWPVPMAASHWPQADREVVEAIWRWMFAVKTAARSRALESHRQQEMAARLLGGEHRTGLGAEADRCLHGMLTDQRLTPNDMARHVEVAWRWSGPQRFGTYTDLNAFAEAWGGSQARLLASVAEVNNRWSQAALREWGRAYFYTSRLLTLDDDLEHDQVFFALDEMERQGVTVDMLRRDRTHDAVNKLLWKTVIRAQDAYAQALPLVYDVEGRMQRTLKESWLGGLEALRAIQKRNYQLDQGHLPLTLATRAQIWFQARFARTTFKRR